MTNRIQKIAAFLLVFSLIINIYVIFRLLNYEEFFDDEIASSVEEMKDSIVASEVVLCKVIYDKKIDERQSKSLYNNYKDFKMAFYRLQNFAEYLEAKDSEFLKAKTLFKISDYLGNFGYKNGLLKEDRETKIVNLTDDEIELFNLIYEQTRAYSKVLAKEENKVTGHNHPYNARNGKWVMILEKIDACSIEMNFPDFQKDNTGQESKGTADRVRSRDVFTL
ncbi:MAG: hypothetical protein AAGU27_28000 [Dehalobacterium sp.]